MSARNDIKNSTARIWTKAQLKETLAQCKANGFVVTKEPYGTTEVINPENNDLVLKSLPIRNMMAVRIDQSYFEPYKP